MTAIPKCTGDLCHEGHEQDYDTCATGLRGYHCTREKGHEGPHVACGTSKHNYLIWTDDEVLYDDHEPKPLNSHERSSDADSNPEEN